MINGNWNGEPALFCFVRYKVKAEHDKPLHWYNVFDGQIRQACKVFYAGQVFYIDNEHGDGYFKLTGGLGSPRCGHKSISCDAEPVDIPDTDGNVVYDTIRIRFEEQMIDDHAKKVDPLEYEKMKSLKEYLKNIQSK